MKKLSLGLVIAGILLVAACGKKKETPMAPAEQTPMEQPVPMEQPAPVQAPVEATPVAPVAPAAPAK